MRALVTGAAKRVGRGIALELGRAGFEVAVHYRSSRAEAESVVAELDAMGASGWTVQGDLGTVSGCADVVKAVTERWSSMDALVNNASTFSPRPFAETTLQDWDQMLAINARAPFLLSRDLLPLLSADGGGTVVHLCDIGADRPVSGYTAYSVSKAALVMLVRSMAVELAPTIRTVGISPGQVAWPDDYPEEKRQRLMRRIPMNRVGTPADVGKLARFLVCDAPYLNGVVVPVDGGLHVRY